MSESSGSDLESRKGEKKKPRPKPASAKKPKPGPRTKKLEAAEEKPAAAEADMFTTEAVQYCDDCDAIFLSMAALKSHRNTKHAYDGGKIKDSASDSSSAESVRSEAKEKSATKKTS